MSWKAGIIAGGIILILLAGSNFVNWKLTSVSYYEAGQNSVIQDSMAVTAADTVWAVADTVIKYEWLIVSEAVIDTVNEVVTYSTHIDTAVVINKDTVAIINQDISLTEDIFEILMKIDIRPVEKIINVIKTEFRTVIKKVAADPPFYNTWIVGFISGVISFLLLVIFG